MAKRLQGKGGKKRGGKKKGDLKKVLRMTPGSALTELMRAELRLDKNRGETEARHKKNMRAAVEGKNLHLRAFKTVKRELRIEANKPGALAVFLAHFDHHREVFKLDEVAAKQGDFFDIDPADGTESPKVVPIKLDAAAGA